MRLLNTETFELQYHIVPPEDYAILSHTWRKDELIFEEYSWDECRQYSNDDKAENASRHRYKKIRHLCDQARKHDIPYAWIDTICIDKSSSAELAEAINSMYQWYSKAIICYVYLDDVDDLKELPGSRWLTRGWTLQELIAPSLLEFYSKTWKLLGSKATLATKLSRYTHIDVDVLRDRTRIANCRVATKFSWAADRKTTRVEDQAYCLFGLFGVNMPLLYGEGDQAFQRLQKEVLRVCHDDSILAWSIRHTDNFKSSYQATLAPGASGFRDMHKMIWPSPANRTIVLTESGCIKLDAMILVRRSRTPNRLFSLLSSRRPQIFYYLVLMCHDPREPNAVATGFRIDPCSDPQYKSNEFFAFARDIPGRPIDATTFGTAYSKSIRLQVPAVQPIPQDPMTPGRRKFGDTSCITCTKSAEAHGYSVRALQNSNREASTYIDKECVTSWGSKDSTVPFQSLAFMHNSKKDAFIIDFLWCTTGDKICFILHHTPFDEDDAESWVDTFDCVRAESHRPHEPMTKLEYLQLALPSPRSPNKVFLCLRQRSFGVWALEVHVTGPSESEEVPDGWVMVNESASDHQDVDIHLFMHMYICHLFGFSVYNV